MSDNLHHWIAVLESAVDAEEGSARVPTSAASLRDLARWLATRTSRPPKRAPGRPHAIMRAVAYEQAKQRGASNDAAAREALKQYPAARGETIKAATVIRHARKYRSLTALAL